jgi:succinate dehydrogenase / fumarate reductase flavoprotein subunit
MIADPAIQSPGRLVDVTFYVEAAASGLDRHVPAGLIEEKWTRQKDGYRLVAPNYRRKHADIIVGTGLAILSLAELLTIDAMHRTESCGGHFREESQTAEGERLRDDEHFSYVGAWQFTETGRPPILHQEPLDFE